jgi:DNA helicase II / ATP-dependent DNA helicase PcrA
VAVGDIRQATFATNLANRNAQYRRQAILKWFVSREKRGILAISSRNKCFRSNQAICDFADALFPDLPRTESAMQYRTDHDGVFQIKRAEAVDYYHQYAPVVLRYDRRADTLGLPAQNFGSCKGKTFDRVLIFPTAPMRQYLNERDPNLVQSIEKFYVAVTRAKYSVAFVVD